MAIIYLGVTSMNITGGAGREARLPRSYYQYYHSMHMMHSEPLTSDLVNLAVKLKGSLFNIRRAGGGGGVIGGRDIGMDQTIFFNIIQLIVQVGICFQLYQVYG